ncbi:MAG TPA: GTP-binding protein [Burkholderiales bacterium]|nr:GTP-binding protein [Burkholderiales bacterium]
MTVTPIYIIGGFLGSGKTTLLKRLVAHALERGIKPAVLMNEFGDADVDSTLLHEHERCADIELRQLLSGCICCDLTEDLTTTVAQLIAVSRGGPLFIETTGLANVGQVATGVLRAVGALPSTSTRAHLASVVAVVDTPRFSALSGAWSEAESQFGQVDTVILNKLDATDTATRAAVEQRVRTLAPRARVLRASYADVDPSRVLRSVRRPSQHGLAAVTPSMATVPADTTRGFENVTFEVGSAMDLDRLETVLCRYRSVLRLKGFVRTPAAPGLHEVQWVPGAMEVRRYQGRRRPPAEIVVIGRRIPWERLLRALNRCAVPQRSHRKRRAA